MKIVAHHGPLEELTADLLVLVLDPVSSLFELGHEQLDERVNGLKDQFGQALKREYCFDPAEPEGVGTVAVYSSALEKGFTLAENLKTFLSRALKLAAETGRKRVAVALNSEEGGKLVEHAVEGALVGTYVFEKYRSQPGNLFGDLELVVWTQAEQNERLQLGEAYGQAVNFARDLVCEPPNVMFPAELEARAKELSEAHGFDFESWDEVALAEGGYVGLSRVGAGSEHPPRMIRVTHSPEEAAADVHLVLLGKGVTFDTGGISLKPGEKMDLMKGDMAGAAAVLGAMDAIGKLKPNLKVTALVVSAENSPDGKAYRPADILVFKNGKSVHIGNTDAEGRLCLADGLMKAGELGATHIIDVATLTGSCSRALGPSFTGVMGTARALVNALTRAGGNWGESYWKLPLPLEYREMLKTPHADMNNVGGEYAGAITAGLFLKEFVPARTAWAHLDIAGTFWKQKPWKYYGEGPSGTAVKTLVDLACNWAEHFA